MEIFIINGNSVTPFFNNHDVIEISPIKSPFDIQLLDFLVYQEGNKKIIKRCQGIPGEGIKLEKLNIIIDGKRYYKLNNEAQAHCWDSWINSCLGIIPLNHFVLFGTVPESLDSKQKGFVQFNQILGRPNKCQI